MGICMYVLALAPDFEDGMHVCIHVWVYVCTCMGICMYVYVCVCKML